MLPLMVVGMYCDAHNHRPMPWAIVSRLCLFFSIVDSLLDYYLDTGEFSVSFYRDVLFTGLRVNQCHRENEMEKNKDYRRFRYGWLWFQRIYLPILALAHLVSTIAIWNLPNDGPLSHSESPEKGWVPCSLTQARYHDHFQCSAPLCYYSTPTKWLALIFVVFTVRAMFVFFQSYYWLDPKNRLIIVLCMDFFAFVIASLDAYVLAACHHDIPKEWIAFLVILAGLGLFANDLGQALPRCLSPMRWYGCT